VKFARAIAATSVAGAALGLVPAAAASASTASQPQPAAGARPSAAPVAINTCGSGSAPAVRPREFGLSCDSSEVLVRLRWTRWTAKGASGHGADSLNDCKPDCAQGKFHNYPVHVNFWGLTAVKGHSGEKRYTHYSLTYTKKVPYGLSRKRSGKL